MCGHGSKSQKVIDASQGLLFKRDFLIYDLTSPENPTSSISVKEQSYNLTTPDQQALCQFVNWFTQNLTYKQQAAQTNSLKNTFLSYKNLSLLVMIQLFN